MAQLKAVVHARFNSLCSDRAARTGRSHELEPAVRANLFRAHEREFHVIDVRGWNYTIDLDFTSASLSMAGLRWMARLDWHPVLTACLFTPDGGDDRFLGIIENFCRVLVSYRLHELGGVVVHSAAIESNAPGGGAFVFLGRSGAGKSTTTLGEVARRFDRSTRSPVKGSSHHAKGCAVSFNCKKSAHRQRARRKGA